MPKQENVIKLTSKEFSELLKNKRDGLLIVDFFAEWCVPCKMMEPIFESLAKKNFGIKFVKINVDEAQELASEYEISAVPCVVFFKDGKEVDRIVGAVSEEALKEKIEDYLEL